MSTAFGSLFSGPAFGAPTSLSFLPEGRHGPPAPVYGSGSKTDGFGGSFGGVFDVLGQVFGSFQEAQAARANANAQAALLEANAALLEQRASDDRVLSNVEKAREDKRNRLITMREFGMLSERGGMSPTGFDAIASNMDERELDALTTQYSKHLGAHQLDSQAGITRMEAGQVRSAGKQAARAAMLGGFTAIGKRLIGGGSFSPLSVGFGG